jgi:hypothetical protein
MLVPLKGKQRKIAFLIRPLLYRLPSPFFTYEFFVHHLPPPLLHLRILRPPFGICLELRSTLLPISKRPILATCLHQIFYQISTSSFSSQSSRFNLSQLQLIQPLNLKFLQLCQALNLNLLQLIQPLKFILFKSIQSLNLSQLRQIQSLNCSSLRRHKA